MSQNHHRPSSACVALAPLLPLAAHDLLSAVEDARLRAHLATCAHCQAELASHAQVDAALRRTFSPRQGAPLFSRKELIQMLDHSPDHPAPAAPPVPTAPQRRPRRLLTGLSALAATLIIVLLAVLLLRSGHPSGANGIAVTASQGPGLDLTGFHLNSISMISPDEGWAVGSRPGSTPHNGPNGQPDLNDVQPVILHYKDGHWSQDQLPADLNPQQMDMTLSGVSMVSATEGWAVGSTLLPAYRNAIVDGITFGVLLHYTGGKWVLVQNNAISSGNGQIFGFSSIVMRSASDGWMIASGYLPGQTGGQLLLRYDGRAWTPVQGVPFGSINLQQVAAAPDGGVWMSGVDYSQPGFDGDAPAAIVQYDGTTWTREQDTLGNDRLLGLAMVSASEGWAVGYDPGGTRSHYIGPQKGLIAHYQHGVWTAYSTVSGPASDTFFYLSAVAMISASEGWAVGTDGTILHYQHGAWTQVHSPTSKNLAAIAMVSPGEGWATGAGVILHYQHGAWSVYQG